MTSLPPRSVADLFGPLQEELVSLLRGLEPADWERPTISRAWRVKEVAAHLLDGQLRRLSFQRDGWPVPPPERPIASDAELVAFLGDLNARWVAAAGRLSPRVLVDLLDLAGRGLAEWAPAVDPSSPALFPVAWAGEAESEAWFDLARDLTEHWHHQQQIRLAVGAPLLLERRWSLPVLETFLRAAPHAYRGVEAPAGTAVAIAFAPPTDAAYALRAGAGGWTLHAGLPAAPAAAIRLDPETAWRLFTRSLRVADLRARAEVAGDERWAEPFFRVRAAMV